MPEEMRKRLEEAAIKLQREVTPNKDWGDINYGFVKGAEWMFKECGGMTVLHDMRKMILEQCKEWLKENYHLFDHFDKDKVIADFERDMNKLWEGEK